MKVKDNVYFEGPHEKYVGELHLERYSFNDRIALSLVDTSEGFAEPIAFCTVCVPGIPLNEDQVIIKNYSENQGMLKSLIDQEIIANPTSYVNGFVTLYVCDLLIPIPE